MKLCGRAKVPKEKPEEATGEKAASFTVEALELKGSWREARSLTPCGRARVPKENLRENIAKGTVQLQLRPSISKVLIHRMMTKDTKAVEWTWPESARQAAWALGCKARQGELQVPLRAQRM